jgi:lysozyme
MTTPYFPPVYTDCIVDLYHGDCFDETTQKDTADFVSAVASGITLVIHKASQGTGSTDNLYASRKPKAIAAGALWGAYHFCDNSDPIAQANHFLSVVGDTKGILLMLDAEEYSSQVTVAQVAVMATYIKGKTGQEVLLYMGRNGPDNNGTGLPNSILSQLKLLLPEYGTSPILPEGFTEWDGWQHTDGTNGSHVEPVPGLGAVDRSYFAGTAADLPAWFEMMTGGAVPVPEPTPTPSPSPTPVTPTPTPTPTPPPFSNPFANLPASPQTLQTWLKAAGFYNGNIDGLLGELSQAAIGTAVASHYGQ